MIIDAHYHLEESIESVETLISQMKLCEVDRVALIPKLCEPFELDPVRGAISKTLPRMLCGRMKSLGTRLYNSAVTSDGKLALLGKSYKIYQTPQNDYIDEVITRYPDKFYGWVAVNPKVASAVDELDKWIHRPGWIGAKVHPYWHDYPIQILDDLGARCAEVGIPILVHLGSGRGRDDIRYLPGRHPSVRVIYAHAGVPNYRDVWTLTREMPNVYVDLSGTTYIDDQLLKDTLRYVSPSKCIFGTDGPYLQCGEQKVLNRISSALNSQHDKELIFGDTFQSIIRKQS